MQPLSAHIPDFSALEIFLAIARTGSVGAAGREFGLTQQAVSARLASIESQTGVALVVRSPRGSQLTAAGVAFAEWADRLLEAARYADAGLASLRSGRKRAKVAASQTIAEQLVPRWLVSLRVAARRRNAGVNMTSGSADQVTAAVRSGAADLGFLETPLAPTGLRSRTIAHDELVVVVAADHRWASRRRPVSAAELSRTPLVTREPGSGTRESLTSALHRTLGDSAPQAHPVLELSSAAAVRAAVIAGAGPAVDSHLAVADAVAIGRLRIVAVPELDLRRELRAVWVGGRVPRLDAARDLLLHIAAHAGH